MQRSSTWRRRTAVVGTVLVMLSLVAVGDRGVAAAAADDWTLVVTPSTELELVQKVTYTVNGLPDGANPAIVVVQCPTGGPLSPADCAYAYLGGYSGHTRSRCRRPIRPTEAVRSPAIASLTAARSSSSSVWTACTSPCGCRSRSSAATSRGWITTLPQRSSRARQRLSPDGIWRPGRRGSASATARGSPRRTSTTTAVSSAR